MAAYAERTKVPVSQTKTEIEKTLLRYAADSFICGNDGARVVVAFRASGRHKIRTIEGA